MADECRKMAALISLWVVLWQTPAQGVSGGATAVILRGDRAHAGRSCGEGISSFRLPILCSGGGGAAADGWTRGVLRLRGGSRKNSKVFWKKRHKFQCQVRH